MLGLILLYFVGKAFYQLAHEHDRSPWGFAILGVVSYYAGLFIGGIIIAIAYELFAEQSVESVNEILLSVMALPIGVLSCWGFYQLLKRSWSKAAANTLSEDVLDADLMNNREQ